MTSFAFQVTAGTRGPFLLRAMGYAALAGLAAGIFLGVRHL
jgi:hypothetical protein